MTVKRQRLLTLFLTLQKRSTLIWKWEQPTHGKDGQKAKWEARRSWWRARSRGRSQSPAPAPQDWGSSSLDWFWFCSQGGWGVGEGQIKDWPSYQDQKRDHALSWFKQREKENILQMTASFILDKESTSLMFLLPT